MYINFNYRRRGCYGLYKDLQKTYCNEFFMLHTFPLMLVSLGVTYVILEWNLFRMHVHTQNACLWSAVRLCHSFKTCFSLAPNTPSVKTHSLFLRNKIKYQRFDTLSALGAFMLCRQCVMNVVLLNAFGSERRLRTLNWLELILLFMIPEQIGRVSR
jgi:hypothetical protein